MVWRPRFMWHSLTILKRCVRIRTTATTWQNTDKEHTENNPKMPWQATPRVLLLYCFALSLSTRVHVFVSKLRCKRHFLCSLSCVREYWRLDSYPRNYAFQSLVRRKITIPTSGCMLPLETYMILRVVVYVCVDTWYFFFGALPHNRRFWSISERQSVTLWVEIKCRSFEILCKDFCLVIITGF